MKSLVSVKILDCRGKEYLEVERFGGDVKLTVKDRVTGETKFIFVVQMREPPNRTYEKIESLFKELKKYLIERWTETQFLVWNRIDMETNKT